MCCVFAYFFPSLNLQIVVEAGLAIPSCCVVLLAFLLYSETSLSLPSIAFFPSWLLQPFRNNSFIVKLLDLYCFTQYTFARLNNTIGQALDSTTISLLIKILCNHEEPRICRCRLVSSISKSSKWCSQWLGHCLEVPIQSVDLLQLNSGLLTCTGIDHPTQWLILLTATPRTLAEATFHSRSNCKFPLIFITLTTLTTPQDHCSR